MVLQRHRDAEQGFVLAVGQCCVCRLNRRSRATEVADDRV
jgi:hypothetical protein